MNGLPPQADDTDWHDFYDGLLPPQVRRESLVGVITEEIGSAIVRGELPSGIELSSVELAERFNTSRTPVREALLLLEKAGLISISPRRPPRVAEIPQKEILEIYQIRELLLVDAIDQMVEHALDDELARLADIVRSMDEAIQRGDIERGFLHLVKAHDLMVNVSRNDTLRKILDRLRLQTSRVRFALFSQPGHALRTVEAHKQLSKALSERDAIIAKGFMQSIIRNARARLEGDGLPMIHRDDDR